MSKKKLSETEIVSVLWIERGHHIEVVYADERTERRKGDLLVATELAEGASLQIVHTPNGMARWVRDPESWQTR